MKTLDLIRLFSRTDKWCLGGGNRLLWVSPFPVFLDYPGFWDNYEESTETRGKRLTRPFIISHIFFPIVHAIS